MTNYQTCHIYYGDLTRETDMARDLLERHGKPTPQIVKELRHETDMPMAECARMLRCIWRDMQLERLQAENVKLRELVADAHACKENDGCCEDCYADEGDCPIERRMYELGVEP